MIEQNEIDEKLLAYLLDELDDVEREEVKAWLEESECNKEYFREFQRVHLEFQWGVYAREVKSDFNVLRKKDNVKFLLLYTTNQCLKSC